jgi:predicted transcriptional regulator
VKRVHEDVAILLDWGLIERTDERKIVVPYGVIHADFDLHADA